MPLPPEDSAPEQERQLANLVAKGQYAFERKDWQGAIDPWTHTRL